MTCDPIKLIGFLRQYVKTVNVHIYILVIEPRPAILPEVCSSGFLVIGPQTLLDSTLVEAFKMQVNRKS